MVPYRHSSIFSRLRGLLEVTRLVRSESDLPTVLDAIARTISESLGFGTVVVNLYRPAWDEFQVTAVHGSEAARAALLGESRSLAEWQELLDPRWQRRGAFLVPHGEYDWRGGTLAHWVPDLAAPTDPDAWHPEDALLVPMVHTDGHVLGILSVDEPVSGRRPGADELDVLVAVAEHAALAVEQAQEAAQAARYRAALERLLAVSSRTREGTTADESLRFLCEAVRDALGFGRVGVDLLDEASGLHVCRACVGCGDAGPPPPLARAELEALLRPELEPVPGCFLVPAEAARALLPPGRPAARSTMNGRGPHAWSDHRLHLPLVDRAGATTGFLWVDDPQDRLLPTEPRLQALRAFANQAAAALESAASIAALREAADRRRALIDASPLAIVDLDRESRVRSWNPAAERMFGWAEAEVLGRPLPWLPEGGEAEHAALRDAVLAGESFSGAELERVRKDGSRVWISLSTAPLRGPDGDVVGIMSIAADVTERREAGRALVASEARTAAVLAAALEAVITIDHEGRIVEFNPTAEEVFGWTRDEARGRPFLELTLPPRMRDAVAEALRTGAGPLLGSRLEVDAVRSDGREFSAELALSRVAVDGPPLYAACLRDVTRRKARDEQLRETVAQYRTLVERLPIATYVNDLGLPIRTTWISPQVEQLLGYRPEEWLEEGFYERLLHTADREQVLARVRRTHETGDGFRGEYRLLAKDGREVWVLDETVAVRDEEYRPLFLQGFLIDVSERKAAEEALRQSERLYRLVVENTADSVTLLGPDGRVLYSSPATQRLLGWSEHELLGRPMRELVHPDDVDGVRERLQASLAGGEPRRAVSRIRHRDGGWLTFEGTTFGILDERDEPAGMLVIARPLEDEGDSDELLRLVG